LVGVGGKMLIVKHGRIWFALTLYEVLVLGDSRGHVVQFGGQFLSHGKYNKEN